MIKTLRQNLLSLNAEPSSKSSSEGRLFLVSPTFCGFEMEISRFRALCSRVSVQTNARSVLDFCDGERPACAVLLIPSGPQTPRRFHSFSSPSPLPSDFSVADILTDLSAEIIRRSLPVSLAVYTPRATAEELALYFRSGADDFFTLSGVGDSWEKTLARLWSRWDGRLPALTLRRNLKIAFNCLSPPLQDTAKMLYMGCTNQEIAQASERKLRTVEQRRAQIMTVMQANNFAELIRHLGLVLEPREP